MMWRSSLLILGAGLVAAHDFIQSEGGIAPLDMEEQIVAATLKRSQSGDLRSALEASEEVQPSGDHVNREYIDFLGPHNANARINTQHHEAESMDKLKVVVKRAEGSPFSNPDFVSHDLFGTLLAATTIVCSAAAIFGIVGAGACWYKMHRDRESASEASYPQYGGTGPAIKKKSPTAAGDASLAFSAHLHHFNQTKQKILSQGAEPAEAAGNESDLSEAEGDEGDFSVYECPGLAPTGDIEVSNPLFENSGSPPAKDAHPREGD